MRKKLFGLLIALLFLIFGFLLMNYWYISKSTVTPGSFYPELAPFYVPLLSIILIFIGIGVLLWDKVTKGKKILKIILLIILLFCILISGFIIYQYEYTFIRTSPTLPTVFFEPDTTNNTLTVSAVSDGHFGHMLYWENIILASGNATLPNGYIDEGDMLTNCSGTIKIQINLNSQLFDLHGEKNSWDFT